MRQRLPDLLIILLLFALPLIFFAPVTLGGKTLLPADNLYQWEPYASYQEVVQAPDVPHNALVSDLILQNYVWRGFIRESISGGELPLWNPNLFAGVPFFAAGQNSALYPLSFLHYVLPLRSSYGWYAVLQLWLAGLWMYALGRGLGQRRIGGLVAAISWQLSAFFLVRTVFPMIQSAASWLPLLLLMIEFVIQSRPLFGRPATLPWAVLGAGALGLVIYAGHIEITYYTLLVMGFYAVWRLLAGWWAGRQTPGVLGRLVRRGVWLLALVVMGLLVGAGQLLPLYELVGQNFREGSATLEQVRGWAYPPRRMLAFLMPNFFGSPAHHAYFDMFSGQTVPATVNAAGNPITTIYWGIKNYVEGGQYLGILTMALAGFGLVSAWGVRLRRIGVRAEPQPQVSNEKAGRPYRAIFAGLGAISLTFIFGLPTYALLYYLLPGINQLHSPFRWMFPLTLSVAVLAGFGADALARARDKSRDEVRDVEPSQAESEAAWKLRVAGWFGWTLTGAGLLTLLGLGVSYLAYPQLEPLVDRALHTLALAENAFADAAMFYSYQFKNVLVLGVALLGAGLTFLLSRRPWTLPTQLRRVPVWQVAAVLVITLDLMAATWGFNPAADPALLDFTPPAFEWLQGQQEAANQNGEGPFRITTLESGEATANANIPWLLGIQDVRGYDSIIPKQYTAYMALTAPQFQLDYNRVAPLATWNPGHLGIERPELLDALGLRYLMTEQPIESNLWQLAYEDEAVFIYENPHVLPRAYTLPDRAALTYADVDGFAELVDHPGIDLRNTVLLHDPDQQIGLEQPTSPDGALLDADLTPQSITAYGNIQVMVDATISEPSWLILNDSYFDGWRAFVRPGGTDDDFEWQLPVHLVNGNFRGVLLDPTTLADHYAAAVDAGDVTLSDTWTVRFRYSPQSFQIGAFLSFIAAMVIVFTAGVWLWRTFYGRRDEDGQAEVQRLAKNSALPIVMNLFNKGIDFAFAFIMLRVLGPQGAGIYYYAIVVFGWFDILTNFGLNTFLTREVARDRGRAGRYLFNTSALRIGLATLGIPFLIGFLFLRQSAVSPPLDGTAIAAIALLYIGLIPNSLSTGLSALFYGFEKAEYPAAIATVGTISKAVLGLAVLIAGFGVIGLAGVSIVTNLIVLGVMLWLARPLLTNPGVGTGRIFDTLRPVQGGTKTRPYIVDRGLMRHMMVESWPLMINHLLATVFYKIDVILMEAINGVTTVGWYSTAYKWLDALQVIPAFLSAALLPVMSRQAQDDTRALVGTYRLSTKLLFMVALPVAIGTTFLAPTLILVLGGQQYLPDGAVALQLMVWSIPIGWVNSVTQYMLIALDRQRILTRAFVIAVTFNIIANLILLPRYSYRAAAVITIMSEALLLGLFLMVLAGALRDKLPADEDKDARSVSLVRLLWRPVAAGGGMAGVLLLLWGVSSLLALALGSAVYLVVLIVLRPFDAAERQQLMPLIPARIRARSGGN